MKNKVLLFFIIICSVSSIYASENDTIHRYSSFRLVQEPTSNYKPKFRLNDRVKLLLSNNKKVRGKIQSISDIGITIKNKEYSFSDINIISKRPRKKDYVFLLLAFGSIITGVFSILGIIYYASILLIILFAAILIYSIFALLVSIIAFLFGNFTKYKLSRWKISFTE